MSLERKGRNHCATRLLRKEDKPPHHNCQPSPLRRYGSGPEEALCKQRKNQPGCLRNLGAIGPPHNLSSRVWPHSCRQRRQLK
eukprot:CAMPEP_0115509238 /NCGR_PEP_ID=MMETSP0271-20121206/72741_1 /TAXON_ID=71861 /ORGANISM="Scrippsiella trochoidea, Strain CCMP3099" /LENGTH=82 /DNA_ID=CAMNT_0002939059 /DNA_START=252 /DNA_END=500 /DNA_ORIENTATION=+